MPSVPLWPEDLNPPARPTRKSGAQPGNKNALGYRRTPETKQHLSELTKGRPAHENTRQALIESNKRRKGQPRKPFSEEHRQRLAENQRRHWEDPEPPTPG